MKTSVQISTNNSYLLEIGIELKPIWNEDADHLATIADDLSLAYSRLGVMQNLSWAVAGFIIEYDSSSEARVGGERCLQAWTLDPSSL